MATTGRRGRRNIALPSQETIEFAMKTGTPILISVNVVAEITGLARPTLTKWRREGKFPEPITLSEGDCPAIAWVLSDVQEWIEARRKAAWA